MKHLTNNQNGMALVTSLLLLVSLSAIGLGLMFSTTLENKIVGNMKESDVACQNAETGIEVIRNILVDYRYKDMGFTRLLSLAQDHIVADLKDSNDAAVPQLDLENVDENFNATTGDPLGQTSYSTDADAFAIDESRYQLTIWDDVDNPVESADDDSKSDVNFTIVAQSVGSSGNATCTIRTELAYTGSAGNSTSQHKQDEESTSSTDDVVRTDTGTTNTFTPSSS